MPKYKIDYEKIYQYLATRKGKVVTASGIAAAIGVERVYGATMTKLVRDDMIIPCAEKGFYKVPGEKKNV